MAESTDNLGGAQGSGAAPTNLGETVNALSWIDKIKLVFQKARKGEIGSHIGNTNEGLNKAKEAFSKATEGKIESEITNAKYILDKFVNGRNGTFKGLKPTEKFAAMAGGNLRSAGKGEIVLRGTGVLVGVGGLVSAGKDVFAPERDENGNRKKSWVKTGLKAVGSAALVVASVVAGGKNRAMGI